MKNHFRVFLFGFCLSLPLLFQACTRNLTPSSPVPVIPPTNTPTVTVTFTATTTVTGTITVSCVAQTILSFTGNLNSAQRADQPGGLLQMGPNTNPVLPFGFMTNFVNLKISSLLYQSGNALFQQADFSVPLDADPQALPNHTTIVMNVALNLSGSRAVGTSSYAWNQGGAYPPACTTTKTVVDTLGNSRQIQFLFYQVNDIGTASPAVNPNPPHQAAYAWYAFETTGGLQPGNNTLIGGTGVYEGDVPSKGGQWQGRCTNNWYWDDLLYFNSDGSLASEGGVVVWAGDPSGVQDKAYLYLPLDGNYFSSNPNNPEYVVELNFGTAGMLGYGKRDGITGDAAPSLVK